MNTWKTKNTKDQNTIPNINKFLDFDNRTSVTEGSEKGGLGPGTRNLSRRDTGGSSVVVEMQ